MRSIAVVEPANKLHFNKDQVPPVRAFWSLTMYDERQLLAANPIDRFAIGDRDKLAFNPDGSLNLYIQRESPGRDKQSNWLPGSREWLIHDEPPALLAEG